MTVTQTVRELVVEHLRSAGLEITAADEDLSVQVGDFECGIVVSQHVVRAPGRVTIGLASGPGDDMRVHVAVFVDADGAPTGSALVISEATLDDTLKATAAGWQASVDPALSNGAPTSPLDVCVAPLGEIGEWVRAELADWFDDNDDDEGS